MLLVTQTRKWNSLATAAVLVSGLVMSYLTTLAYGPIIGGRRIIPRSDRPEQARHFGDLDILSGKKEVSNFTR